MTTSQCLILYQLANEKACICTDCCVQMWLFKHGYMHLVSLARIIALLSALHVVLLCTKLVTVHAACHLLHS